MSLPIMHRRMRHDLSGLHTGSPPSSAQTHLASWPISSSGSENSGFVITTIWGI